MHNAEYKVLRKYIQGRDLDEEDRIILEMYQSIGLVGRFGFSFERKTETAGLTQRGIRRVEQEKIFRSPIRRFFHNWRVCLAI